MRPYDRAPNYKFARLVTANDTVPPTGPDWGWNFQHYELALFRIIPLAAVPAGGDAFFTNGGDLSTLLGGGPTSNPALEAYFYDDQSKLWCKHNPAVTFAAAGVGVASEIELNAYGRKLGLAVTSGVTAGQAVVILAAAYFRQELE